MMDVHQDGGGSINEGFPDWKCLGFGCHEETRQGCHVLPEVNQSFLGSDFLIDSFWRFSHFGRPYSVSRDAARTLEG